MLNAGNLALIAFSRHHGHGDGQIFALAVMAVAAVRGRRRPRPDRRDRAAAPRPRRRQAHEPARVTRDHRVVGAWICLLAPLAGALADHARAGPLPRRRAAGFVASASVLVAFVGALHLVLRRCSRDSPSQRSASSTAWTWLSAGNLRVGLTILVDPLSVFMMLIVAGVGSLIVVYSIGYMDGDDEERRYFAYMALFVFSMLLLVEGGNLLLLLAGWGLVGLSSYLLIGFWHERPTAVAAAKKAFVMNAVRRRDVGARALPADPAHGHSLDYGPVFELGAGGARPRHDGLEPRRARPARRRGREVGAAPAPHLAPGRDGGPDAGQRAHPRGDDGDRRRLPDRPHARALRARAVRPGHGGRARRRDARLRRPDRARPDRHQARDRVLDDVADRLHVPRASGSAPTRTGCST